MTKAHTLADWLQQPDAENAPQWLLHCRQQQRLAFLEQGLPTRSEERFKYADFTFLKNAVFSATEGVQDKKVMELIQQHRMAANDSILLVLVNGDFMQALSDKLPPDVIACRISEALHTYPEQIRAQWSRYLESERYPFASLNAALSHDGLFFAIKAHYQLEKPIHLLSLITDEKVCMMHTRHVFQLGEGSQLALVDEHVSSLKQAYLVNKVTTWDIGHAAKLQYYKIQQEGEQAVHLAHTFIEQKQNSESTLLFLSAGSRVSRDEVVVNLKETGAHCQALGFYQLANDAQYIDHHIDINHQASRTQSDMLYKGIIKSRAKAVFNGRLYVEKAAQKIVAYQANHTILLSDQAEMYSKPELEIYADDVKCKHGASTARIDQDAIFYLRSRGLDHETALQLLLQGFRQEVIERITHHAIRQHVQETL